MRVLRHPGRLLEPHDLAAAWSFDDGVVLGLAAAAALYGVGLMRLWRHAGPGRGIREREAAAFCAGWLLLVIALVSPLHALGAVLFSAHMAQHELLIVVAAPLLVLGRPLVPLLWALPAAWRAGAAAATRITLVHATARLLTTPVAAWLLHAAALWVWHLPGAYQAALRNSALHGLQHITFLATGILFWWTVAHGRSSRIGYGAAIVYLFTTALHTGGLGALLTFAPNTWYVAYQDSVAAWGLTRLEDQQLAGLIMWIPGGVAYLIMALAFVVVWLRESDRRVVRWQQVPAPANEQA